MELALPGRCERRRLMKPAILTINSGSSSIKFGLFGMPGLCKSEQPALLAKGAVQSQAEGDIFEALLTWVQEQLDGRQLVAIGHRIVHGGQTLHQPTFIDAAVLSSLEQLTPLAPLHQPRCLEPVRAMQSLRPDLPQIACFDTAFHHSLQQPVSRYAIPRRFEEEGVRKYGFHGLSYEYIAGRLQELSPELAAGRSVVAHLGNGASLCAMRNGQSVDTTMGFSTLDGLVMGSRCGSLDPGVVIYLQKQHGLSADQIEDILYRRSGLLGVSDISGDMRVLCESTDARAQEAIDLFTFRAAQATAMMANSLAGLDCLIFTGGIGEHAQRIRGEICERLRWLGVELDAELNDRNAECISRAESAVKVLVIPTDEEVVIARSVAGLMA